MQILVPDDDVFKAVVKIIDRSNKRFAEWPTARLSVWLDIMRDNSDVTAENAFDSVDIDWSEDTEEIAINESLNSSRISLNISAMKETLFGEPLKSCFKTIQNKLSPWSNKSKTNEVQNKPNSGNGNDSPHQRYKKKLIYDDIEEEDPILSDKPKKYFDCLDAENAMSTSTPTEEKLDVQTQKYLSDLRKTTAKMRKLYQNQMNENVDVRKQQVSGKILTALDDIERLTNEIRHIIKNNEPSPRKTPKSVRFILD